MSSAADLARTVEALLFLSPEPVPVEELVEACEVGRGPGRATRSTCSREELAPGKRGLVLREVGGGFTLATDPIAELPARRLLSRAADAAADPGAGRDAGDRRLPAAGLAAGDRADPRRQLRVGGADAERARPDRGGRALAVRRRDLRDHRRCSSGCSASPGSTSCPTSSASTRRPRTPPSCASACSRRASSAARAERGRLRAARALAPARGPGGAPCALQARRRRRRCRAGPPRSGSRRARSSRSAARAEELSIVCPRGVDARGHAASRRAAGPCASRARWITR